jgi:hypothetical protein
MRPKITLALTAYLALGLMMAPASEPGFQSPGDPPGALFYSGANGVSSAGEQGDGARFCASILADGQYMAFTTLSRSAWRERI